MVLDADDDSHAPDARLRRPSFRYPGCAEAPATLQTMVQRNARTFLQAHVVALLQIVFLLHQAMLSIDAIGRSVLRVFVFRKRLLEWETAAEAENAQRPTATVDLYLAWSP